MLYQETYLEYFILDNITLWKQNSRARSFLTTWSFVIPRHEKRVTLQCFKKAYKIQRLKAVMDESAQKLLDTLLIYVQCTLKDLSQLEYQENHVLYCSLF